VELPEEVINETRRRGIDVVDLVINAISRYDPMAGIKVRVELAKRYLEESKEYLKRNDAAQASEKAYKAVEECIKALAEKYNTPEYNEAAREGRWYTHLLQRASNTLASTLGDWVAVGWASAYALHVWGFHEVKLSVSDMTVYMKVIEDTVNKAIEILTHNA